MWVTPVSQCDWSLFLLLSLCEWLKSASVTGPWSSSHSASVSDSCQSVWLVLVSATQPMWVTPVRQCDWSLILQPLSQCEWFLSASVTGPCFCYSAYVSDSCQAVWLVLDPPATQPVWVTPVSQCDWSLFLILSQGEWLLSASVTGPCFCYSALVSDSSQPVLLVLDPPATQPVWVILVRQCDWSLFLLLSLCEWLLSGSVTGPWSSSHSACVSDSCQAVWLVLDPPATQPVWVTPVNQCDWSLILQPLSQCEWLQSTSVTGPWSSSHSANVSDSSQPVWVVLVSATQPGWVTPVSQCDWSLFLLLSLGEWLQSASVTGPWSSSHSASVSDSCQAVWLVLVSATQPVWVTPVRQCDWSLILQPLSQCEWLLSGSVTGPWSSSHSASGIGPCFYYLVRVSDSSQPVRLVLDPPAAQPMWVTPVRQCDWSLILQPLSQGEWLQSGSVIGSCFCYTVRVSDSSQPVRLVLDPPAAQPVWVTPVSQCDWSLILQPLSQGEWLQSGSVTGPCFFYSARVSDSSQLMRLVLDPPVTQPVWVIPVLVSATQPGWVTPVSQCDWFLILLLIQGE